MLSNFGWVKCAPSLSIRWPQFPTLVTSSLHLEGFKEIPLYISLVLAIYLAYRIIPYKISESISEGLIITLKHPPNKDILSLCLLILEFLLDPLDVLINNIIILI
jgi:hypothetical protein